MLVLVVGTILAPGQQTVAAALRAVGLEQGRCFERYHRVLSRARWSVLAVDRVMLRLLVVAIAPTGPLVVGVDEKLERRRCPRGSRPVHRARPRRRDPARREPAQAARRPDDRLSAATPAAGAARRRGPPAAGLRRPLWVLLGGRSKPHLTISRVISLGEPATMATAAARHVAAGFATVKVKLGDPDNPGRDALRLTAVREAVGPEVAIKVDVNQGWRTAGAAIAAIRAGAPSCPASVEQPVAWWDLEGLAEVRRHTGATIMADEGCHGPRDILRVAALRAADLVNIKLMKRVGLQPALALNAIAEAAGIAAQVGTMVESAIASAAGLHLALGNVVSVEMGGPLMLAADVGDAAAWYARDRVTPPARPGLGVAVDEAAARRFGKAWWVVAR